VSADLSRDWAQTRPLGQPYGLEARRCARTTCGGWFLVDPPPDPDAPEEANEYATAHKAVFGHLPEETT
jgi:hypothetical protein